MEKKEPFVKQGEQFIYDGREYTCIKSDERLAQYRDENGHVKSAPQDECSKVAGTVDCTPSWESLVPLMVNTIRDGSWESQKTIIEEVTRMAQIADAYVKHTKQMGEEKYVTVRFYKEDMGLYDDVHKVILHDGLRTVTFKVSEIEFNAGVRAMRMADPVKEGKFEQHESYVKPKPRVKIAVPDKQPSIVLKEYDDYAVGKNDMGEEPLTFGQWAELEIEEQSPISKDIVLRK